MSLLTSVGKPLLICWFIISPLVWFLIRLYSNKNKMWYAIRKLITETITVYSTNTIENGMTRKMTPFDSDSFEVKVDNCCSRTLSGHKTDFMKGSLKPTNNIAVEGYNGAHDFVTHTGTIHWRVLDDQGSIRDIIIPNSLYVPTNKLRLLSPQHMAQMYRSKESNADRTRCVTFSDHMILEWDSRRYKKTIKIDAKASNIGRLYTVGGYSKYVAYATKTDNVFENMLHTIKCMTVELIADDEVMLDTDDIVYEDAERQEDGLIKANIEFESATIDGSEIIPTIEQKEAESASAEDELLCWHYRLSHVSMARIQTMARLGYLPARLSNCRIPLCQACVYGKLTRRPWRIKPNAHRDSSLDSTFSGQCTSVDQLESPLPGFIGQMKGKLTKQRYKVATIFIDHFSSYSFVYLQSTTNAEETLKAKKAFEKHAETFGVNIIRYHADNGRFAEKVWKEDILQKGQQLTFSGVGAHHQNGRAEKRIRDMQDLARTALIHAHRRWPHAVDVRLWPYALRHANNALNNTPFPKEERTPIEKFSGTEVLPNLQHHHPFGCPAYALDGAIQSGKKAPKWTPRARLAIYLGHSVQHAKSVGLLLSLTTGLVSPQFHIKFDDTFETLLQGAGRVVSSWQDLAGFGELIIKKGSEVAIIPGPANNPIGDPSIIPELEGGTFDESSMTNIDDSESVAEDRTQTRSIPEAIIQTEGVTTRSGREIRAPSRYEDYVVYSCDISDAYEQNPVMDEVYPDSAEFPLTIRNEVYNCFLVTPYMEFVVAYAATADPDVMYLNQAMAAPDRAEFLTAMQKEVQSHTDNENWVIMNRDDVPTGQNVLPSVWAMRRKRDIATQKIYKWKARLNIHGGKQQKGINYWETYAPVASWSSIRIVLIVATINKWKTKQLDFVLAFPQAPVETDLYMEIPAGFKLETVTTKKVLKLKNNLYGQKQAGRVWNLFLTEGLNQLGFTQSKHDPCIFWRASVIIIIYTDDTIVTGPKESLIDQAIKDIGEKFEITNKESVDDFLGVKIIRDEVNGTLTLTQPQLINSILDDLGLDEKSNSRLIPALSTKILQKYETSAPHNEEWHYRSVIGKLNYLEKSSRPDLAYSVHQCARFSEEPKEEHTRAVKLIGRYLLSTRTQGLIYTPKQKSFECYCDADFSGNWDATIAEFDGSTARSRSGYVIMYAGCPVSWGSRLQTEIALSSTESEYISLSQGLREVIPLMNVVQELVDEGFQIPATTPKVMCQAFEDNSGALEMATTHKMRPRTKHLNIKYHHFREAVQNGLITICSINTLDQLADIFTKPLGMDLFVKFRKFILGW